MESERSGKLAFNLDQLESIFKHTKGTRWELASRLAYETGLRLGDICMIKKSQIDFDNAFIDFRTGTRKSGKEHLFYIPGSIDLDLDWSSQFTESDFLFHDLATRYQNDENKRRFYADTLMIM